MKAFDYQYTEIQFGTGLVFTVGIAQPVMLSSGLVTYPLIHSNKLQTLIKKKSLVIISIS